MNTGQKGEPNEPAVMAPGSHHHPALTLETVVRQWRALLALSTTKRDYYISREEMEILLDALR